MNVIWETMVAEMRANRTELDNQRHFTGPKEHIEVVRDLLTKWTVPREAVDPQTVAARTALNLRTAADHDLFELG